jgi:hypothetical protein
MCSSCGFPEITEYWADAGISSNRDRTRSRLERSKKLQQVLKAYGLSYHDDGMRSHGQIDNLVGRVELVLNMEELWIIVENLLGKPADPLEENFF